MKATVLGSTGFIGRAIVEHLTSLGYETNTPNRDEIDHLSGDLGIVFYCIGMTGNFRNFPRETVEAQVTRLSEVLTSCKFSSFMYLSSTRVYGTGATQGAVDERTPLKTLPSADTLYDLSKLLGEALCNTIAPKEAIIARLSNVVGAGMSEDTFLGSILVTAARDGTVEIGETPASSKDYVWLNDVVTLLAQLAIQGRNGCFNIASGIPVSHAAIAKGLRALGYKVSFREGAKTRIFPTISIEKIREACDFHPQGLLDGLQDLIPRATEASE